MKFPLRAAPSRNTRPSETRVFPLLELGARKSRHLEKIIDRLAKEDFAVSLEKVPYEFQKGGNEMLRVKYT